MPAYLCHGFRWSRRNIRVYVVVQNLDDAAPEWVIKPGSSKCVLESFYTLFDFLPACAPPGNEKLQHRRALNHTNYYNLYNEPLGRGRGQGMETKVRSRSHGATTTQDPYCIDKAGESREKGWWGREKDRIKGRGYSHSHSRSQIKGGGPGDREWQSRQQRHHHLAPGKPRSHSESRVVPSINQPHNHYQHPPSHSHSHSRTRADGSPSLASSASSTTLGATSGGGGGGHATSTGRTRRPEAPLPPPPEPQDDDVLHNDWSVVNLLEEHDPSNLASVSQDYAYVADYVVKVDLSVGIVEEMAKYDERQRAGDGAMSGPGDETLGRAGHNRRAADGGPSSSRAGWFEKLRDQLQRGEEIKWYIVVCEDEERNPQDNDDEETVESYESTEYLAGTNTWGESDRTRAEQADYESRRRMLQMHFGRPADEPADGDGEDYAEVAERERIKELETEREKRRLFQMQVQNPPKVPEKDYPPAPRLALTPGGDSISPSSKVSRSGIMSAKKSMDFGGGGRDRSKTPKGGLRRLFSRGRLVDERGAVG